MPDTNKKKDDRPWDEKNPYEIARDGYRKLSGKASKAFGESAADKEKRLNLNKQGAAASAFADNGEAGFGQLGAEAQAQRDELRARAGGKGMMSTEMLRQGLQQQYGQQRSMAAGASPNNAAMAARTAANNMGRASAGMSGQAAMAGLQEQRDASEQLSGMINAGRSQEMGVALGSRSNANTGYGAGAGEKSWIEKNGPAIVGAASLFSDRNAKTNITDGDGKAKAITDKLKAHSFSYRDEKNGKGQQLGAMAQDLEKAGLGHVVEDGPEGKRVHGGKVAMSSLALTAALAKRVSKLEGNKK